MTYLLDLVYGRTWFDAIFPWPGGITAWFAIKRQPRRSHMGEEPPCSLASSQGLLAMWGGFVAALPCLWLMSTVVPLLTVN